ncbi:MAG: hypothetical protein RLZZ360_483 [Candidatus Parcubacteria bacterium]
MGQIKFHDESTARRNVQGTSSGFTRRLVAWGVVKNERQANAVLLLLIFLAGLITAYNVMQVVETPPPPILNEIPTP